MKPVGIYHQIDLQALDLAATLRAKGADGQVVTEELARLASDLGISPRTADKRTRPARKAWIASESPVVERAAELFIGTDRANQLALHMAVLFRAYPFLYHTAEQVGTAQRLGAVIRQATVRDRLVRRYGYGSNVHQGVQKVLQSFVSWGLIQKTAEIGVYKLAIPKPITPEVAEVLIVGILEVGERDAISMAAIGTHPALFAFEIPTWGRMENELLNMFSEGANGIFLEIAHR